MTFSSEMGFLPRRHPHEITCKVKGAKLIKRINRWLIKLGRRSGVYMLAKLDPHHNVYATNETWLVEVTPYTRFETSWLEKTDASYTTFMAAIDEIIATMRQRFDLVPSLVTRKGDTDLHWPGTGNHVHLGADLFNQSIRWYRQAERFHRNLAIDYANRPFIRWLLAHWIGDGGSHVAISADRLAQQVGSPITADEIFSRSFLQAHAIKPRFMATSKSSYLTFEFRMVGMVENARQLRSAVLLLKRWMEHWAYSYEKPCRFNLTLAKWEAMTKEDSARAYCRSWVESLSLDWADYEQDFFERNYVMRIKHGAFV